jgi:hypothetical protein
MFSFFIVMAPLLSNASFFSPELAAKSTADFLNNSKTLEGALGALSAGLTSEESRGVRQLFSGMKVKMDASLPLAVADGAKVTFSQSKDVIVFNSDRTFSFDGRIYRPYKLGELDHFLKNAMDKMNGKENSLMNILIPRAQAMDLSAGFAMAFRIIAIGAAGTAVVVGTVGVYGGKEIYESWKNNSIECSGPYFKLRSKTRTMLLLASSKENVLDPEKINQVFGEKVSCNATTAAKLQSMIRAEPSKGEQLAPGTGQR